MPKTTTPAETADKMVSNRQSIVTRVQATCNISTVAETERLVKAVFQAMIDELTAHIDTDKYKLKIPGFGQFKIAHTETKERRIPTTGEKRMTDGKRKIRFNPGSELRALEPKA